MSELTKIRYSGRVETDTKLSICDYLASQTTLSKAKIKIALEQGAVQVKRERTKQARIRRARFELKRGDQVYLWFDWAILSQATPSSLLISDQTGFSVWHKPAGVLTQGTEWGDHGAILRQAERYFTPRRPCFPVHRLDRETSGLLVIAHTKSVAANLSQQFGSKGAEKRYLAQVKGHPPLTGEIDTPLEGKPALTQYRHILFDSNSEQSLVEVQLQTGRTHQIRKHLTSIGHPLIGDPRYGRGNKNSTGLQLVAYQLSFNHPTTKQIVHYSLQTVVDQLQEEQVKQMLAAHSGGSLA